jgi:hypothetical protein
MQEQQKITIGFWPTFAIALAGLLAVGVVENSTWGVLWGVKVSGLVLVLIGLGGYFLWRSQAPNIRLVRTGLEWVYSLTLLALVGSWILSPDPRQGLTRVSWLLAYVLLFYILADACESGVDRRAVIAALLTVSGALMFLSIIDVVKAYSRWFVEAGSWCLPPSVYRFESLLGSPTALMGLANLCGPLALVALLRVQNNWQRALLGLWLAAYFMVLPFSLSNGGQAVGAVWIGLLLVYGLKTRKLKTTWGKLSMNGKALAGVAGLFVLAAVVAATIVFIKTLDAGDSLGGMRQIWLNTIQVWSSNPWFGSGPGRFGFGYLTAADSIPPRFWMLQAMNLPAQLVAEFGLAGGFAFLGLLIGNIKWLRERFRLVEEKKKGGELPSWRGALRGERMHWWMI